ncbi:MAG: fdrA domain protein [Patescibacteria group bacterium]
MAGVDDLLARGVTAINVGLPGFAESLRSQGAQAAQVDWIPPAGGDREMLDLLAELL